MTRRIVFVTVGAKFIGFNIGADDLSQPDLFR